MRFRFGFFQRTISFLFCLLLLQCLSFQNSITNSDFKYLDHLLTAGYAQAADITDAVVLIKGRLRYDRRAKTSYVDISLQNVSSETFLSPIRVIIDSITDPNVTVANADGTTLTGKPYFQYNLSSGKLAPGETSDSKKWIFSNPLRKRFNFVIGSIEGEIESSNEDLCPDDPDKVEPGVCGCGVPDTDTDQDGTPDCHDNCPDDPEKTEPGICGCGVSDVDTDADGTVDCNDQCPEDPNKTLPGICGCGVADTDTDGDGSPDCIDTCPDDQAKIEPGECGCGVADTDTDEDGTADCNDECPDDPNKIVQGVCGCGISDVDTDADGTADCNDQCPEDPNKTLPGICGCGVADTDTDGDGSPDCIDTCPNDSSKIEPGICGCGVVDMDTDNDGVMDCFDECPDDPLKTAPGICGCGIADTDSDSDGTADCLDNCPNDPDKTEPGACGCGIPDTDSDGDGIPDCQEGPVAGNPPEIVIDPLTYNINEGEQLDIAVSAQDPDGDPVTLAATPLIKNAVFTTVTGVAASGTMTFNPDFSQAGNYTVIFKAVDTSGNIDLQGIQIVVSDVNRAPLLSADSPVDVQEGGIVTIPLAVSDPDDDILTLTADPLPDNALFVPATKTITFTPDFDQAGSYDIICTADDGTANPVETTVTVNVTDVPGGAQETEGLVLTVDPVESPTFLSATHITGTVNSSTGSVIARSTSALITSVDPAMGEQGETLDVVLTGESSGNYETHFTDNISQADFGDITVNSITINGPTEAVANITIGADVDEGAYPVSVITDNETAVSALAFNVITGHSTLSGLYTDMDTGQAVAGAIVTLQGTSIQTVTDANGYFYFNDVPAGKYQVIINGQDHEPVVLQVAHEVGEAIDLGTVESAATVFNPNTAPNASIGSVHNRGLSTLAFNGDLEEARQLILDTIIATGGNSYGMVDAYGNQLNPNVEGEGLASLRDNAADDMAVRWQQGHTVPLGNMLYSFIKLAEWENDDAPSPFALLAAIQSMVNDAWQDTANPSNALAIAMFAGGKALVPGAPPTLSMDTPLNPLQSYLVSSTLLGYVCQEIGYTAQNSTDMKNRVAAALVKIMDLLGPTAAYAYSGDDPSLVTWDKVFDQLSSEVYDLGISAVSGFAEDSLGVIMPSMTFNGVAKTTAVSMWVDFMNTMPQGSHVSSITTDLVNNPDNLLKAFQETRDAALELALMAEHAAKAAEIVEGALTGIVGNLSNFLLEKVLMGSIINNLIETSRPSAPYVERAVLVPEETGGLPSVNLQFHPCYDEVNTAVAGADWRYFYAIYRKSTGQPMELLTILPSYKFCAPFADLDETRGRIRFKYLLTQEGRNVNLVFSDTNAPAGTNVYKIVTRVMRGRTVPNAVYTPMETKMVIDLLVSKASPGASATFNLFNSTMDAMKNILQGTIYQVSDFSEPARVFVGTPVENLFPRLDLATAELTREIFVSIPDTNTILKWTPSGMKLKAVAGFAAPYQIGLACDVRGNLYSDNHASDMLYGGRIFRFSTIDGSRALVGTVNYYSQLLHYARSADVRAMTYGIENGKEYLFIADGMESRITRLDLRGGMIINSMDDRNVCHDDIRSNPEAPFNFQSNTRLYYNDASDTLYVTQGPELLRIQSNQVENAFIASFDPFSSAWLTGVHGNRLGHMVVADMLSGDIIMVPNVFMGSGGFGWDVEDFRKLHRIATGLSAPQDLKVKPLSREFYVLDARGIHHMQFGVSGRIWDQVNSAPLSNATLLMDGMVCGNTDTEGYFTINDIADTGFIEMTIQSADGRTEMLTDAKSIYVESVGPTILTDDVIFDPPPVPDPTDYDTSSLTSGDLVIDEASEPFETPVTVTAEDIGTTITRHFVVPAARVVVSDDLAGDLGLPEPPDADIQPAAMAEWTPGDVPQLAPRADTPAGGRTKKTFPLAVRLLSHPGVLKMAARSDGSAFEARRAVRGTVIVPADYPEPAPSRVSVRINGTERQADVVEGQFELPLDDMAAMSNGMNTISVTAAPSEVDRVDGFLPPSTRSSLAPVGIYGHSVSQAPEPSTEPAGENASAAYSWEDPADPGAARETEGIGFTGIVAARASTSERPIAMPGMDVIVYRTDGAVTTAAQARKSAVATGRTDSAGYYEITVPVDALEPAPDRQADPFDPSSMPDQEFEIMVTPPVKMQAQSISIN